MKQKICFVIPPHWSHHMGGSQFQVKCILEQINVDDFEIYYITRKIHPNYKTDRYKIMKVNNSKIFFKNKLYFEFFSINKLLRNISPDIVYQRIGGAYTGFSAYYAKKHSRKFVWHISHEDEVKPKKLVKNVKLDFFDKHFLEYGIRHADKIIAQTHDQSQLLYKHYNKNVAAVVPNFHPFPSEEIDKEYPVKIVWVANFKRWKQPEIFIRLSEDLINKGIKNIECIMIGAPSKDNEWQKKLQDSINRIRTLAYLGPKPIETVNKLLAESHIFVNTSRAEGFANTFIQAWMRNVPVISLHCNPDGVFDKEEVGFCTGSYERMLESVIKLVENSNLRDAIGRYAREYAYKTHSVKNAKQIFSVLLG